MTRRDSLGMAAKEHTEKLTSNNDCSSTANSDVRRSLQSDVNTYGVNANQDGKSRESQEVVEQQEDVNVFMAGTFAEP